MKRSAWSAQTWACVLVGAAGLGGCMQTSTYGTGEMPEMALFREVTGDIPLVGAKDKAPIEYQPRAPLVMPPAAGQLPTPMETASVANPDWPQDPESEVAAVQGDESPLAGGSQAEYRRLKPLGEALGNRRSGAKYDDDDMQDAAYDIVNSKKQRETFQAAIDDAEGVGRTERRYLTEPPDAYREPAATAPQEFDKIKRKRGGLTRWLLGG